ncbi:molecular chaperone SurA [Pseudomethylobacillus aquaticus]|uniref:Chaperone SurA n=1 Tax=Pseudomethylobacillus aquaticus TaxID=2676064 RepID=A0A3N0V364_9PROT|nr:peptidylprolyl isomerase [Pseudomethylobacillus aquaticus]ROH87247.1 molecular chaperone SurA [Pseudomethylobacillus aquaticus]
MTYLRFILGSLLLIASYIQPVQAADIVKLDRIVAVVDNGVITERELTDRIRTLSAQIEKQGGKLPPQDVLQKQILERLINDSLLLQYAAQTGLRVDDGQLDKTIERIANQNQLTVQEFRKTLEDDGLSFRKFREDIRSEIIIARLREREVENRINVTEAEVDNFLTTQSSRKETDEYDLSHILVRVPDDSSTQALQQLKAKIDLAMSKLNSGVSFGEVSATYSDAPNALEGGDLGWKPSSQLPELFLNAVQSLQAGQTTAVLRSPNGFHILRVNARRGGTSPLVVQQTHVRHILIKLSEVVSETEGRRRALLLKERLDNGVDFAEVAKVNSEDSTAVSGGDLGWVNPGDTVPPFEQAMNALAIKQISEPVRSPFGWHIIQVLERRQQDMTREAGRIKARQEIRSRKAEEAYQEWVRELRDRAYVEMRLEDKF